MLLKLLTMKVSPPPLRQAITTVSVDRALLNSPLSSNASIKIPVIEQATGRWIKAQLGGTYLR